MYKETPDETLRANSGKLFGDTSARVSGLIFGTKILYSEVLVEFAGKL